MKKRGNKLGVSLMLSYVILISITLGIAMGVYAWLKYESNISPKIDCKDGTSLLLEDYDCPGDGTIRLNVKNNGRFSIDGFILTTSKNERRQPIDLLNYIDPIFPDGHYYFRHFNQRIEERPRSTISRWRFEEGLGDSRDLNPATIVGGLEDYVDSEVFGRAINMDGVDYLYVPQDDTLNLTNSFTIGIWFKRAPSSPNNEILLTKNNQSDALNKPSYVMEITAGRLKCAGSLDGSSVVGIYEASGGASIDKDKWYYGVCTFNGSTWRIYYLDYENEVLILDQEKYDPGTLYTPDSALTIGYSLSYGAGGKYFKGSIGDVSIFKTALSQAEIISQYYHEKRLNPGEWKYDLQFLMNTGEDVEVVQIQPFIWDDTGLKDEPNEKIVCTNSVIKQNVNCPFT